EETPPRPRRLPRLGRVLARVEPAIGLRRPRARDRGRRRGRRRPLGRALAVLSQPVEGALRVLPCALDHGVGLPALDGTTLVGEGRDRAVERLAGARERRLVERATPPEERAGVHPVGARLLRVARD